MCPGGKGSRTVSEGSGLFFESEAQRRIVETLCNHPSGDIFMPYLETITGLEREDLACELCRLENMGLIAQSGDGGGGMLAPFILPYICTPKGRMVMRTIHHSIF